MIKKVILIGYQPLTEKVKKEFFLESLIAKGFEVEYWDISPIYFPGVLKSTLVDEYILPVKTFPELEKKIANENNEEHVYIVHITYEYRVLKLFRLLTKYNCITSFFARGSLPVSINSSSLGTKLSKALNPQLLANFMKSKYAGYVKRIGKIKPYDIVFTAGEYGYLTIGVGSEIEKSTSRFVNVNSPDYDTFNDSLSAERVVETNYCLFLDEYLPHHPDCELLGIATINPERYYRALNVLFDRIETQFGITVVIAAHPKAEKYRENNPFEGRAIYFNQTASLTKFCQFTLAHTSTSQGYSVLYEKPTLSLTSEDIKSVMPQHHRFIRQFSATLGGALLNIDDLDQDKINFSAIDKEKYDAYKYKHLTSFESEHKKTVDIIVQALSE